MLQFSLLQSRLAASVMAPCLLLIFYLSLLSPQFALAADITIPPNNHELDGWSFEVGDGTSEISELTSPIYESDFQFFDRNIMGRQDGAATTLANNVPVNSQIEPGQIMTYVFQAGSVAGRAAQPSGSLELRDLNESIGVKDNEDELMRRQQQKQPPQPTRTLWISANTCDQPGRVSPDQTKMDPPQLTLFVSTSVDNTSPGPDRTMNQNTFVFTEGAVMFNTSLDKDVYLSIAAPPDVSSKFFTDQPYSFELAASIDQYYHVYDAETEPDLIWVDSDSTSTLLTTRNLTSSADQVLAEAPYVFFAQNKDNVNINGLWNSFCGLQRWAQIRPLENQNDQRNLGLKKGGELNLTRQEFYISNLNASSRYSGVLARVPKSSMQKRQDGAASGGGSVVFRPTEFDTKPEGTCTFIFNLNFCTETQYAVPGNSSRFQDAQALAAHYDNYTQTMYKNFEKVLAQVPCQADSTARYSLVRDCDDCRRAYKNWLCSVAIPRCEDFSSSNRDFLQMRNINSLFPNGTMVDQALRDQFANNSAYISSRNPWIDQDISPGPYKEVLPCDDVCHDLVQSCPASMGFSCPLSWNKFGYNGSYGRRQDGNLSCNYQGSTQSPQSLGNSIVASWIASAGVAFIAVASVI